MRVIQIFSALLTPVVVIVTTYIAVQQYRTNKLKIKLELFEKRYAVYDGVKKFILHAVRNGTLSDDAFSHLNATTQDAFFLFDDSADEYIQLLREKGARLRHLWYELGNESLPIGDERNALSAEDADLCKWFGEQLTASKRVFKEYLHVL